MSRQLNRRLCSVKAIELKCKTYMGQIEFERLHKVTGANRRTSGRRLLIGVSGVSLAAVEMFGQLSPPPVIQTSNSIAESKRSAFELATIKPALDGMGGFLTYPGGKMRCGVCTIDMLVRLAFEVQPYQIIGMPNWAHSERYSVDAIPPETSESHHLKISSPTNALTDEQRQMLQSLLIDRFQLKFHRDIQAGMVYSLARGSGSLRLFPPKHPDDRPWAGSNVGGVFNGDGIAGTNISMPLLAKKLSVVLQRPVLDETEFPIF